MLSSIMLTTGVAELLSCAATVSCSYLILFLVVSSAVITRSTVFYALLTFSDVSPMISTCCSSSSSGYGAEPSFCEPFPLMRILQPDSSSSLF